MECMDLVNPVPSSQLKAQNLEAPLSLQCRERELSRGQYGVCPGPYFWSLSSGILSLFSIESVFSFPSLTFCFLLFDIFPISFLFFNGSFQ